MPRRKHRIRVRVRVFLQGLSSGIRAIAEFRQRSELLGWCSIDHFGPAFFVSRSFVHLPRDARQISPHRLAGFRGADKAVAWRKLSQSYESCASFGNGICLSHPQRAAVVKTPENVEAQLHVF